MSIEEKLNKSKLEEEDILEGDFDIVPAGEFKETSVKRHLFVITLILLVGFAGFGLGRLNLYKSGRNLVKIIPAQERQLETVSEPSQGTVKGANTAFDSAERFDEGGEVVASKNGSKYHYPWCGGAKQISEKNKITFSSIEEARKAGYTPAANCKGLK